MHIFEFSVVKNAVKKNIDRSVYVVSPRIKSNYVYIIIKPHKIYTRFDVNG